MEGVVITRITLTIRFEYLDGMLHSGNQSYKRLPSVLTLDGVVYNLCASPDKITAHLDGNTDNTVYVYINYAKDLTASR